MAATDAGPGMPAASTYSPTTQPEGWSPYCANDGYHDCGRTPYQYYANAEFLLWNFRNDHLPNLATAVPVGLLRVTSQDTVLGGANPPPTTSFVPVSIVSNPTVNPEVNPGDQLGARLTIGTWLDNGQQTGIEASGFYIQPRVTNFLSTTGNSVNQFVINTGLVNQTFVATMGGPPTLLTSTPVVAARQSTATTVGDDRTQMYGGEINLRCLGCTFGAATFSGLAGASYLEFREGLNVSNNVRLSAIPGFADSAIGAFPPLISFSSFDSITTRNRFYAPQIGGEVEIQDEGTGVFFLVRTKVAVGVM